MQTVRKRHHKWSVEPVTGSWLTCWPTDAAGLVDSVDCRVNTDFSVVPARGNGTHISRLLGAAVRCSRRTTPACGRGAQVVEEVTCGVTGDVCCVKDALPAS